MSDKEIKKAVVYCRVSSVKQLKEGDGLASQETRCREFAKHKNYKVVEAFKDEGVSGSLIDRPRIKEMLSFLKRQKNEQHVVIIDDISRLARGLETHLQLRLAISDAGGKLESPSIEFGDDSDSLLVENLLASVSQHQRQKNAEQSKHRMRARAMNGYWVFHASLGYKYERQPGHGKLLVRDEPIASIIQEALEGFAHGRFETQTEVKRFLESKVDYPKNSEGGVHVQRIVELFSRPLYAGYIDIPDWGINLQLAKHEPLVSFETWHRLQQRLKETSKAPARKDLNEDFPLRGFITCGDCEQPMTACWSKGRSQKYAYYLCRTKGCESRGKSVRKEKLEGEFEDLLMNLRPTQNLFFMAEEMFKDLWDIRLNGSKKEAVSIKAEIRKVESKVGQFLDRIVETDSHTLISSYENRVRKLEEEKILLQEKIENCGRPLQNFDDTFRTAMTFLANPQNLWASDRIEDKRSVLKLVFAEKLPYCRKDGFRTARISLPFCLLEGLKGGKNEMVPRAGIEPARGCPPRILSPVRLPIPPPRQACV